MTIGGGGGYCRNTETTHSGGTYRGWIWCGEACLVRETHSGWLQCITIPTSLLLDEAWELRTGLHNRECNEHQSIALSLKDIHSDNLPILIKRLSKWRHTWPENAIFVQHKRCQFMCCMHRFVTHGLQWSCSVCALTMAASLRLSHREC